MFFDKGNIYINDKIILKTRIIIIQGISPQVGNLYTSRSSDPIFSLMI